jgi:hypothetical protein
MTLKDKMNAALKKANSVKKDGGDKGKRKDKQLPEVPVNPKDVFQGPFSKMKAKKSIRTGENDTAYAYKKGFNSKQKIFKYADKGNAVDLSKLGALNLEKPKGTNKPTFMKKSVTSAKQRSAERIARNTEQ